MNLPKLTDLKLAGKKTLLRTDFDVPLAKEGKKTVVADDTRLQLSLETINYLLQKKARVIIAAHLGRPAGKRVASLSLGPIIKVLFSCLGGRVKIDFSSFVLGKEVKKMMTNLGPGEILVLENLRFYPEEEKNTPGFAQKLASLADFFVNEAFAVSHREHASIVGVPRFLPSAFGFNFLKETKMLEKVYGKPERPVVLLLGGVKKSKLAAAQILLGWVDTLLVGGKLADSDEMVKLADHQKVQADLTKKGEDITLESAREFAGIIKRAGTIIWSGPMGAYENPRYLKGTEIVAEAVVASKAFSIIGGGDTEAALTKLGLVDRIDYVCSGGGAMLEFLAQRGALPGIEAITRR